MDSVSNKNEYQRGKSGRCVGQPYHLNVPIVLKFWEPQTLGALRAVQGYLYLFNFWWADSTSKGSCQVYKWWIYRRTGRPISNMELRPSWYHSKCSSSQKLPRVLGNPKLHYRFHNNPSPIGIKLFQSKPSSSYTINTLSNNTLHYMHLPSTWAYSFRFLDRKMPLIFLSYACYMSVWSLVLMTLKYFVSGIHFEFPHYLHYSVIRSKY